MNLCTPCNMQYKFLQTHQLKIEMSLRRLHCIKWFVSSRKQTTHKHFGTKGKLEHLCFGQTILIVTNNTTIVYCINKEGSMRSGSVPSSGGSCPAGSSNNLKAWHVMCQLNVFENDLSQEPFDHIRNWLHHP